MTALVVSALAALVIPAALILFRAICADDDDDPDTYYDYCQEQEQDQP